MLLSATQCYSVLLKGRLRPQDEAHEIRILARLSGDLGPRFLRLFARHLGGGFFGLTLEALALFLAFEHRRTLHIHLTSRGGRRRRRHHARRRRHVRHRHRSGALADALRTH